MLKSVHQTEIPTLHFTVQDAQKQPTSSRMPTCVVVVRAGVIKLLEYPPDKQGYNGLLPKLFTEK